MLMPHYTKLSPPITVKSNHEDYSQLDKLVATLETKYQYDKKIEIKLIHLIHWTASIMPDFCRSFVNVIVGLLHEGVQNLPYTFQVNS